MKEGGHSIFKAMLAEEVEERCFHDSMLTCLAESMHSLACGMSPDIQSCVATHTVMPGLRGGCDEEAGASLANSLLSPPPSPPSDASSASGDASSCIT